MGFVLAITFGRIVGSDFHNLDAVQVSTFYFFHEIAMTIKLRVQWENKTTSPMQIDDTDTHVNPRKESLFSF